MSDLHEAIREHLALMRQHGADPTEVARLEQEALGEVSRDSSRARAPVRPPDSRRVVEEFPHYEPTVSASEELVPPTNEYAPTRARSNLEPGEETQEYSLDAEIGWIGSPAWHGGTA